MSQGEREAEIGRLVLERVEVQKLVAILKHQIDELGEAMRRVGNSLNSDPLRGIAEFRKNATIIKHLGAEDVRIFSEFETESGRLQALSATLGEVGL